MSDEPEEVAESAPAEEPEATEPEESETVEQPEEVEESAASENPEPAAPEAAKRSAGSSPKAERRIKQLTAKLSEMERRLNERSTPRPPELKESPRPDINVFAGTLDEFLKADQEWLANHDKIVEQRAADAAIKKREQETEQAKRDSEQKELQKAWAKKSEGTVKRNPEFESKAYYEAVQPTPTMDSFLMYSDVGPDVLDYLYQNDAEADRIRALTPWQQARELIKIEEKIAMQIKGIKTKAAPKVPKYVSDQGSAPAAPRDAAEILYG